MKSRKPKPRRPRNPFAGRLRRGAGFHSETRYGKKNRRAEKKKVEEDKEEES